MERLLTATPAAPVHLGPVTITAAGSHLREAGISPPRFHKAAWEWSRRYIPETVVSNLRPGPALLLAHIALHRGWPLHAVIALGQDTKAPSDFLEPISEALLRADQVTRGGSTLDRDARIAELGTELTIAEIMRCRTGSTTS